MLQRRFLDINDTNRELICVDPEDNMKDDKQHLINARSSFTGCGSTIWQRIKQLYLDNIADLKILLCFSAPLIATGLLDLAPFIVTAIFCGHLGKMELDAYMLCSSFTSITGLPIGLGLCSAFDTIISQIYGGSNLKLIGITIQRGIIILFLSCFPCWAFYVNSRNILLLLGQDPEISRLADLCVLASIPCLPAKLYYRLEQRFLQNQGIIIPQLIVSFIGNILHIITTYVLMDVFNTGLIGAIVALLITHIGYIIGLFIYIRLWKIHEETWSGWSINCLTDWGSFLSLGIPSMLIMCSEWWCYEVSVILAGIINLVQLGGQSVVYQVLFVIYELSSAVGTAAGIKVGNCLGAGDSHQAKKFVKLSFVVAASYATLNVSLMFGLRPQIAAVFTNDKDITALVINVLPLCALFHVLDSVICIFSGLLRGIGKQGIGALAYGIGYCVFIFPIGVPLMFVAKLGIGGFWIGVIICYFVINIFFSIYFWKLNWKNVTEKARERAGLIPIKESATDFNCSSTDKPANLELRNYASLDSTNTETELHDEPPNLHREKIEQSLKKIIIRRVLEIIVIVSVFLISLTIRLTVTHV